MPWPIDPAARERELDEVADRDPFAAFALAGWTLRAMGAEGTLPDVIARFARFADGLDAEALERGRAYVELRGRVVHVAMLASAVQLGPDAGRRFAAASDTALKRAEGTASFRRGVVWFGGGSMAVGLLVLFIGYVAGIALFEALGLTGLLLGGAALRTLLGSAQREEAAAALALADAAAAERDAHAVDADARALLEGEAGRTLRALVRAHPDLAFPELGEVGDAETETVA